MKAVILAGGLGTRLREETYLKPKPMLEIGGKPILWHIMKIFSCYDINQFINCCGYKGYLIKEYFAKKNIDYEEIFSVEGNIISKLVCLIYLLDYTSIYRAILSKTDPSPVTAIDFVKSKLK